MKKPILVALLALSAFVAPAQYSIDWFKVSGGGGTGAGGNFSVSGTIGQPDASSVLTGGNFSLTGGFWSLYAVQTAGLPWLSIRFIAPDSAVVSWPNTGSYALQTNGHLAAANWTGYGGNVSLNNGTNSVTISPAAGNLFFRLK